LISQKKREKVEERAKLNKTKTGINISKNSKIILSQKAST